MDDFLINPDILEIILSDIHQMSCVLNGMISLSLRHIITDNVFGGNSYYNTDRLFEHGSLQALDPELVNIIRDKIYIPDDEWKKVIDDAPEKLKLKGIDMYYVKYSHIDFNLLEYNNYLYKKLEKQTNGFDPVQLGKRIVFMPGEIPHNFNDFLKSYEPLTEEFKLIVKFVKLARSIDIEIKDSDTLTNILSDMYGCDPQMLEQTKKKIVNFMASERDESGLTMACLEKYREKYEACITVTPENLRLYTRARFLLNTYIELNEHVLKHVVYSAPIGGDDTLLHAQEYLGLSARNILTHFHKMYLDEDNYPTFSNLYRFGSIPDRRFPESIMYTNIQKLCFCQWHKPFIYSAQLYEANTGDVYVLVNLKVHYFHLYDFIISKKCMYDLFLYDMDYHYGRLDALDQWRQVVETERHRTNTFSVENMHKRYGHLYHNCSLQIIGCNLGFLMLNELCR